MSDFMAKMHKIRLPLGLCPRPAGGAYSAPRTPWLYLRRRRWDVKRREGEGRRREEEWEGKRRQGREGPTPLIFRPRTAPAGHRHSQVLPDLPAVHIRNVIRKEP